MVKFKTCLHQPMSFVSENPAAASFKFLRGTVIVIEGLIGAGKSVLGQSVVDFLKRAGLDARYFEEYVNEALLNQFLRDKRQYAYAFQMVMLANRIRIYREAQAYARTGGIAVVDRSLYGDMAFAILHKRYGNISESEFDVYSDMAEDECLVEPDYVIFLDCEVNKCLERVQARGRLMEKDEECGYTTQYMEDLSSAYTEAFKRSRDAATRQFNIDWNKDKSQSKSGLLAHFDVTDVLDVIRQKVTRTQLY